MRKLLSANFSRLFHSKVFWCCWAVMISLTAIPVLYFNRLWNSAPVRFLYGGDELLPFVSAVLIGLFLGTDYSNRTIRNKLVAGHVRRDIYGSNWVVCTVSVLIFHVTSLAMVLFLEYLLSGSFYRLPKNLFAGILVSTFAVVAVSTLLLFVSMLIQSRAIGVVVTIITGLFLYGSGSKLRGALLRPEYTSEYISDDKGNLLFDGNVLNPNYVSGVRRDIYEFLVDIHPVGQILQFDECTELPRAWVLFPVYSVIFTIVIFFVGYYLFRRKDIK